MHTPAELQAASEDWIVACVIATEVPPKPTGVFTVAMIDPAIRAVCEVIENRATSTLRDGAGAPWPETPLGVVLQIKQFSGVLRGLTLAQVGHRDIWLDAVQGLWFPNHVARCLKLWQERQSRPALMGGALWYYSPVGMPGGKAPSWAADLREVVLPSVDKTFFRWFVP